jgi:ribose 5-phosphate isomerase B
MNVLFLCTGNTCRSPLAEALARELLGRAGIGFASAGLFAHPGQPASHGSVQAADELGIDLSGHRSGQIDGPSLARTDWVIAMTPGQLATFEERYPTYKGRLGLVGEPGVDFRHRPPPRGSVGVADPFGGSLALYRDLARQLSEFLARWRPVLAGKGSSPGVESVEKKIAIGCDHRGSGHKAELVRYLQDRGYELLDCGCSGAEASDYPDAAIPVGEAVAAAACSRGILLCGSGIGMSIAANKVHGVRASLCHDARAAEMTRRHNDSNVLCLAADLISNAEALEIVDVWLRTPFEGGRHARRVDKITRYEERLREAGPDNAGATPPEPEGDPS